MKKEVPLKMQGAQKTSDEKIGTPKNMRGSKRHPTKKEAPIKKQAAQKDPRQKKRHP
jgi:hypothetical protein